MFGWIPATLLVFALIPPRRAVLLSYATGWLFLPVANFPIPGFTDYTKVTAINLSVLLAVLLFDSRRLIRFRPRPIDLPMAVWCACPLFSSISNGLGVYDGVSEIIYRTIMWGVPYLVGRIYFRTEEDLRELVLAIVIGGLVYVPLCLLEIRLSPQLHDWIYGYHQRPFRMNVRYDSYRPIVFMHSALMVGMWMASSTVLVFWLWRERGGSRPLGVHPGWLWAVLGGTTILCKNAGAISLMIAGCLLRPATRGSWGRALMIGSALAIAIFPLLRISGIVSKDDLTGAIQAAYDPARARSFLFRATQEDTLSEHALTRPVFGWGGYGRARVRNEKGRLASVADSRWIVYFGQNGFLGLGAVTAVFLAPVVVLARYRPTRGGRNPNMHARWALTTVVVLYSVDGLVNAFVQPLLILAIGALCMQVKPTVRARGRRRVRAARPSSRSAVVALDSP
jgi:hypothetical protein